MEAINAEKRFLTRSEVARELGLSIHVINKAIQSNELTSVKLGGRVLVVRSSLDAWLSAATAQREVTQ